MRRSVPEAVVIGVSAGALDALSAVLPALPENYKLPVLVVVHLPPDKDSIMADLLGKKCRVEVREAEDKEQIGPGIVYFAPPDYHLLVEVDRRLSLSSDEPVNYSRPSIDVLFETAADAYGDKLVGVILTGASSDGARGLRAVLDKGGVGIVQRPDQSQASVMPQSSLTLCPEAQALSLEEIAEYMKELA